MKYGARDNEIAAALRQKTLTLDTKTFCRRQEWKDLRQFTLAWYGHKCMKCGRDETTGAKLNVDHIKPRKTHPELALEFSNLQVLCGRCNKRKGNRHSRDYRK